MVRKSRKSREEWKTYKNVFDSFTERNIFALSNKGHFDRLETPLALGKEANIFIAKKGEEDVIVKIYRLENCNFNKMYSYISTDPRFLGLENQKRKVIFNWVQREYRNLLTARTHIKVPIPFAFKDNILVMEMIGDPAEQLKNDLPKDMLGFFNKVIQNILLLLDAGLVHGDLSEFNILNLGGEPIFIDMSQSTTVKTFNALELLERDVRNVTRFFSKHIKVPDVWPEVEKYYLKIKDNV